MSEFTQPFDLLKKWADSAPKEFALKSPGFAITTSTLVTLAAQLGQTMRRLGISAGDIVAVSLSPVPRIVFAAAASHEAIVTVPFNKVLVQENHIGISWIVTEQLVPGFPVEKQILLDKAMFARLRSVKVTAAARAYPSSDSLYRIALSSGTTGRPKAIPLTVEQSHNRGVESINRWAGDTKFMSLMPATNGVGWHAWTASVVRQSPYLVPTSNPYTNIAIMEAAGVESIMGAPGQLAHIALALENTGTKLPKLRHIQSGGSRLTNTLARELFRLTGLQVGNTYSSTEVGAAAYRLGESDDSNYMGELVPITELQIVDSETNEPVPEGEVGIVRVRRDGMVTSYLNDPENTAASFKDGWFYPGDTGKIIGTGLYLGGRESEMINAGGMKVDPTVIDGHVLAEPQFADAAAFAVRDVFEIERIAIAYVPAEGVSDEDIEAAMDRAISKKAPVVKFRVDEIPRNDWGKPLRRELTDRFSEKPLNEG